MTCEAAEAAIRADVKKTSSLIAESRRPCDWSCTFRREPHACRRCKFKRREAHLEHIGFNRVVASIARQLDDVEPGFIQKLTHLKGGQLIEDGTLPLREERLVGIHITKLACASQMSPRLTSNPVRTLPAVARVASTVQRSIPGPRNVG